MPHLRPRVAAYALAGLFALALALDLLWMPVQVADSLGEILDARSSSSVWASFSGSIGTSAYLRPFRIAQIKALFDLANGSHYWLVYRGFHALLIVLALMLFTRALKVSTAIDLAAAACALMVLVGLHTFRGGVKEAFPINHFLEMMVLCLLTLNLTQSRGGWWIDVCAVLAFLAAALTLESGLLVWVVAAAAWIAGWRGVSTRGLVVMTVLVIGYMYVRFAVLATGVPTLSERSSGYLLEMLDPPELQRRFGAEPLWFYVYNVMASVSSVLFTEPQAGVFELVSAWIRGAPLWRVAIPVATSIAMTGLLLWSSARRLRGVAPFDDSARAILVFAAVLVANAALSFAYTKNEIVSVAGAFYAVAAYGAVRDLISRGVNARPVASMACAILLCVVTTGWCFRVIGVHYVLRSQALKHQIDWVDMPERQERSDDEARDRAEQELILKLREDAIAFTLPNVRIGGPDWPDRLWLD
jgi:hypothetical protein